MKRVCIDVGGTFTDCLVLDDSGILRQFKSSTTPGDPSQGLLNAASKAASFFNQSLASFLADTDLLIHGTTLATNTLLTRRGAKVGMITTKGFRDVIDLRRAIRPVGVSMYNVFIQPYEPLVPRWLRLGVEERTLYDGSVLTPLNEQETREAIAKLQEDGVESVAVGFLYSFVNPEHEQKAASLAKQLLPQARVVSSHEIMPVWREYERFSTTVVSAYLEPVVGNYITKLEGRLQESGFKGSLLMMLCSGLVQTVDQCIGRAVFLLDSGPSAAPAGAVHIGRGLERSNIVSIDMGGTSFDVVLVKDGVIPTTTENWVGDERVAIKMVDVHSVGAGGGSIAWIDSLGLLQVGPQSAGADPGPACYGKGTEPTVTDADLILGYVPDDYFLGGELKLDKAAAQKALEKVAKPLGMTAEQTAQAMFTTINNVMANQISAVLTKRGYDVRDFTVVAGGGAGPVHAASIAEALGIPEVVIPAVAGLYSAFGMFAMDIGRDYARSYVTRGENISVDKVNSLFEDMESRAYAAFESMGVAKNSVTLTRTADMRYVGQFHEVEVPVPGGILTDASPAEIVEAFNKKHDTLYAFSMPHLRIEFLTFRLKASAPKAPFQLVKVGKGSADASAAKKRTRTCIFSGSPISTPVYDGDKLLAGNVIDGPAIIEEATTTVVIPKGFRATVDEFKNFILRQ